MITPAFALLSMMLSGTVPFSLAQDRSKALIELKSLLNLLGRDRRSPEIERFSKTLAEKPKVSEYDSGKTVYYSWKSKGISLAFEASKLRKIYLYAEGTDGFSQYQGELPDKLTFADTREIVEAKLGKPEDSGGDGIIEFWVSYGSKGISLTYVSKDTNDLKHRIREIGLRLPGKKK
jgi:hypothetical protein